MHTASLKTCLATSEPDRSRRHKITCGNFSTVISMPDAVVSYDYTHKNEILITNSAVIALRGVDESVYPAPRLEHSGRSVLQQAVLRCTDVCTYTVLSLFNPPSTASIPNSPATVCDANELSLNATDPYEWLYR